MFADADIGSVAIRHQMAILIDILVNNGSHGGSLLVVYRNSPNRTATLGSYEHSLL